MSHFISLSPSANPGHRHATRLLTMIHELHKAGYQRIRSAQECRPAASDTGNMTADGLQIRDFDTRVAVAAYSSSSDDNYFGWTDAAGRSARELASLFPNASLALRIGALGGIGRMPAG